MFFGLAKWRKYCSLLHKKAILPIARIKKNKKINNTKNILYSLLKVTVRRASVCIVLINPKQLSASFLY
jgi:hypothetical protein